MKKVQTVGSIGDFMRGDYRKESTHFEKYGTVYKVAGMTVIVLTCGFDYVSASSGIEVGAKKLYYELVRIGKWVIIFKGGADTIKAASDGDIDRAKKSFFTHLVIYLMLLGFPYGMDKVDELFQEVSKS